MIFKPGYIRLTFPFHASEEEIDFTIEAIKFIAKYGWKLMPFYRFHVDKGTFRFIEAEYLVLIYILQNSNISQFEYFIYVII